MNILLFGLSGSGRTSVGRVLAEYLNFKFIEMDKLILECTGYPTVQEVFKEKVSIWKECELQISKDLSLEDNIVIACGGAFIENELNLQYFREHSRDFKSVYLHTDPVVLIQRVHQRNKKYKKSLSKKIDERIKSLFEKRDALYNNYSDIVIDTQAKTVNAIAELILKELGIEKEVNSEKFIYEQFSLLAFDSEVGNIYHQLQGLFDYWLTTATFIDLVIEEKIEITENAINIKDQDETIRNPILDLILSKLNSTNLKRRPGYIMQDLINDERSNLFKKLISSLAKNKKIEVRNSKILGIKKRIKYEVSDHNFIEIIKKNVIKQAKGREVENDLLGLAFLLDWTKLSQFIFDRQNREILTQFVQNEIKKHKYGKQFETLRNEVDFAIQHFVL